MMKLMTAGMVVLSLTVSLWADKLVIASVYASSEQVGSGNNNAITNINDGDLSTRWAANDGSFPQWVLLDLGSVKNIDSTRLAFYLPSGRTYTYSTAISPIDANYTTVVPSRQSSTSQYTKDAIGATGRFIMVTITAVSNGTGYASLYEAEVYGSTATGIRKTERSLSRGNGETLSLRMVDNHTLMIAGNSGPYAIGLYSLDGRCLVHLNGNLPRIVTLPCRIQPGAFFIHGTCGGRQVNRAILAP